MKIQLTSNRPSFLSPAVNLPPPPPPPKKKKEKKKKNQRGGPHHLSTDSHHGYVRATDDPPPLAGFICQPLSQGSHRRGRQVARRRLSIPVAVGELRVREEEDALHNSPPPVRMTIRRGELPSQKTPPCFCVRDKRE